MKRFTALVLSLVFILSLSSCAGIGDGAIYNIDGERIADIQTYFDEIDKHHYIGIEGLNLNDCRITLVTEGGTNKEYKVSELQARYLAKALSRLDFFTDDLNDFDHTPRLRVSFGEDVFDIYEGDRIACSRFPIKFAEIEGIYDYARTVMVKQSLLDSGFSDEYRIFKGNGIASYCGFSWVTEDAQRSVLLKFEALDLDSDKEKEMPDRYYALTFYNDEGSLTYGVCENDMVFVKYEPIVTNGMPEDFEYIGTIEGIIENLETNMFRSGFN